MILYYLKESAMERDDRAVFLESLQMWDRQPGDDKVRPLLAGEEIDELVDELFARSFILEDSPPTLAACG